MVAHDKRYLQLLLSVTVLCEHPRQRVPESGEVEVIPGEHPTRLHQYLHTWKSSPEPSGKRKLLLDIGTITETEKSAYDIQDYCVPCVQRLLYNTVSCVMAFGATVRPRTDLQLW